MKPITELRSAYYAANRDRLLARAAAKRRGEVVAERVIMTPEQRRIAYVKRYQNYNEAIRLRRIANQTATRQQTRAVFARHFYLIVSLLNALNEERLVKARAKSKRLRRAKPELYREITRRSLLKIRDRINAKRRSDDHRAKENARKRRDISNLGNRYIKKLLTQNTSLKAAHIPNELIEVKRLQLSLKREVEKQNP